MGNRRMMIMRLLLKGLAMSRTQRETSTSYGSSVTSLLRVRFRFPGGCCAQVSGDASIFTIPAVEAVITYKWNAFARRWAERAGGEGCVNSGVGAGCSGHGGLRKGWGCCATDDRPHCTSSMCAVAAAHTHGTQTQAHPVYYGLLLLTGCSGWSS